jgi:polyphosphate kinase
MPRSTQFRSSLAGPDVLRALATAPLPPGLHELSSTTTFHRDLYFDTPDGALHARGVVCRLRYRADGCCVLSLTGPKGPAMGGSDIPYVEAVLDAQEPTAALTGNNEPARRLRAFADPASLRPQIELAVTRTTRVARSGWLELGRVDYTLDDVTLRHGEFSGTFQELKVRRSGWGGPSLERITRAWSEEHGLLPSQITKLDRAEAVRRRLEEDALTFQLGPGRSVAVVAIDEGAVAVVADGDGEWVRLPTGAGAGEAACRHTMQVWLGSRVGELSLAGTAETRSGDRSVQVWVVRRLRRAAAKSDVTWVPFESLADFAAGGTLRDLESLAAYRLVAASTLLPELGHQAGATNHRREIAAVPPAGRDRDTSDEFLDGVQSELSFIARVLSLAEDARVPLLERIRFLSIVSSNLDEFYMASAGSLRRSAERDAVARQRLTRLTASVSELLERQRAALAVCLTELKAHNISLRSWETLSDNDKDTLRERFVQEISPLLTPRAITVSPGHPFPTIPPLTLAFAVMLGDGSGPVHYAYLKLPDDVPRFLEIDGGFLPVEELVRAELGRVYPDRSVRGAWLFRITRLGDLDVDDARSGDLLQAMEEDLSRRQENPIVRVEVESRMPPAVLKMLLRELRFRRRGGASAAGAPEIQRIEGLLALSDVRELADAAIPGGSFPPFVPRQPLDPDRPLWEQLQAADRIVHHPYDDFAATVVRFISDAADDPDVVSMKLTLYRVGDRSPLVDALQRAARAGKDVTVFVELKARFDEARNVLSVKQLESAGVQVVYGLIGLKNHSKIALVVRRETDGLRRYVHIGTGNYNPATARLYTDLGLFSANPEIGEDVQDLFNQFTGTSGPPQSDFRRLLVAPSQMLPALIERIDREARHASDGRGGVIRAKLNGLEDPEVIGALYAASQAGVEIDLLVRGICTLRPGVPRLSERIRVRSTLGRFLEHERIYHFGNAGEAEYFISSADWRPRNLRRRVEVAVPVSDPACRAYLEAVLTLALNDPTAWLLQPDGTYRAPSAAIGDPGSAQQVLQDDGVRRHLGIVSEPAVQ